MNRRGFFGMLAAVALAPLVKRWASRPGLVKFTPPAGNWLYCSHVPDLWTCDPKGRHTSPVMRCLCGMELPIHHFNMYADFWVPGDVNDKSQGIGFWVDTSQDRRLLGIKS